MRPRNCAGARDVPGTSLEASDLDDVAGLRALGAVNDLEFHRLALFERAEARAGNGRVRDRKPLPLIAE